MLIYARFIDILEIYRDIVYLHRYYKKSLHLPRINLPQTVPNLLPLILHAQFLSNIAHILIAAAKLNRPTNLNILPGHANNLQHFMEFVIGAKLSQRLLFVLEVDEGDGVEELGEGEEGVVGVGEEFVLLKFGVREGTGVGGGVGGGEQVAEEGDQQAALLEEVVLGEVEQAERGLHLNHRVKQAAHLQRQPHPQQIGPNKLLPHKARHQYNPQPPNNLPIKILLLDLLHQNLMQLLGHDDGRRLLIDGNVVDLGHVGGGHVEDQLRVVDADGVGEVGDGDVLDDVQGQDA